MRRYVRLTQNVLNWVNEALPFTLATVMETAADLGKSEQVELFEGIEPSVKRGTGVYELHGDLLILLNHKFDSND